MVSDKVDLNTKTYKTEGNTQAVHWECDGSPEYSLNEIEKDDRGTEIVLHISDDSSEFLEEYRILDLLNKYCRFLPVEIQFGTEKFWEVLQDSINLVILSIVVLFLAALIEVYITPALF